MPDKKTDASKIVNAYLIISGIYTLSASLIWGVVTLFLLGAGFELFEVFIIYAVFTASMAVFEIPTGVVADTFGRRMSFLLSVGILIIGTIVYVLAAYYGGVFWMCVTSIVLGLGFTFYSGATEAWLVDALKSTGFDDGLDKIFARGAFVSGAAMLIGTLVGGFLATIELWVPYISRCFLLAIVFVYAYRTMFDIGFEPHSIKPSEYILEMKKVARVSIRFGWKDPYVRLLMIVTLIQSVFFAWGYFSWQPYFLDLLGLDDPWIAGVIAATISVCMMIGNAVVEKLANLCAKRTTILIWSTAFMAILIIGVGITDNFWVAVTLYVIALGGSGVFTPVKQAYLHALIPTQQRATVTSFDALIGSIGSTGGLSGLGYVGKIHSVGMGYIVGGIAVLASLPVLFILRNSNDEHDTFKGMPIVSDQIVAAKGLHDVTGLETEPLR